MKDSPFKERALELLRGFLEEDSTLATQVHWFLTKCVSNVTISLPGGADGKESACNVGDLGSIPGQGRSPGEGNGHSSILAWRIPWTEGPLGLYSPCGSKVLDTTEHLILSLQACYQAATMFHLPGIETESQKMLKGLGNITRQEEREDAVMDPSLHHLDHDG